MRFGIKDSRVVRAFIDQQPMAGLKLDTDGKRLDGAWLGGVESLNGTAVRSASMI